MKKRRRLRILLILLALLLALGTAECFRSNYKLTVNTYTVRSEKLTNGFRVVFLADLHGREFGDDNEKLLDKIAEQEPDLIALGGDIFNSDADEAELDAMCAFIQKAAQIAPTYFGIGNQEYNHKSFLIDGRFDAHSSPLACRIEAAGAVIIDSEYRELEWKGNRIVLGGYMGYYRQPGMIRSTKEQFHLDLAFAEDFESEKAFKLLINHIPTAWLDWRYYNQYPVDLVLSGHYHGGVVRIPLLEKGMYAPYIGWFPPFTKGLFQGAKATCILTTGLAGSYGIPRFFNPPEICVIDLIPST